MHNYLRYSAVSFFLVLSSVLFAQVGEIGMPKWEIDISAFYYGGDSKIGDIKNGSYVQPKGGILGAIDIKRNIRIIKDKYIGISPYLGFEIYSLHKYDVFLSKDIVQKLPGNVYPTYYPSKILGGAIFGLNFGLDIFGRIGDSNWGFNLGGGALLLMFNVYNITISSRNGDIPFHHRISSSGNSKGRRVKPTYIGRVKIGIKRYIVLFHRRFGISLNYQRNLNNDSIKETFYFLTENGNYESYSYNRRLDYVQLNLSVPLSSFKP